MDNTQHVFYIIGSVALGLFAMFLLVAIGLIVVIQRKINNASRGLAMILGGISSTRIIRQVSRLFRGR